MKQTTPTKWQLKFSNLSLKKLKNLDPHTSKLILDYLYQKLETEETPRRFGKPLNGNLKSFWRYRVGDYRIVCEFKENELHVMVVRIAHRREVYKNIHFLKSSF